MAAAGTSSTEIHICIYSQIWPQHIFHEPIQAHMRSALRKAELRTFAGCINSIMELFYAGTRKLIIC